MPHFTLHRKGWGCREGHNACPRPTAFFPSEDLLLARDCQDKWNQTLGDVSCGFWRATASGDCGFPNVNPTPSFSRPTQCSGRISFCFPLRLGTVLHSCNMITRGFRVETMYSLSVCEREATEWKRFICLCDINWLDVTEWNSSSLGASQQRIRRF